MIESLSSPRCVWSSQATREATHCPPVQLVRTSVRRCNPPKEATGHPRRACYTSELLLRREQTPSLVRQMRPPSQALVRYPGGSHRELRHWPGPTVCIGVVCGRASCLKAYYRSTWYKALALGSGPTDPCPIDVHMEPFSTSAHKGVSLD